MRRNLSASNLHRAALCAASACLPQVREATAAATRGTAIHKYIEAVARGADPALALSVVPPEHRTICEAIDIATLPAFEPDTYRSEVAVAWDAETGWARELGTGLARDYSGLDPTEIPGTADVLALGAEAVFVADYKTGWKPVPPAAENLQLRFLALAACRAHERKRAHVAIIRLREDGSAFWDHAELNAEDLLETELVVRALLAQVDATGEQVFAGETPNVTVGEHCSHCPSKHACPAYTRLVRHLAATPDEVVEEIQSRLTPELAAQAYQRLKLAEDAVELAKKALQGYARQHPIDLGGGIEYGEVETTKTTLDPKKTFEVLAKLHGEQVAVAAVEPSVSQASIKRALEAHRPKGAKVQAAVDAALEALRAAGALTEKPARMLKEHRVRPALLAAGGAR